jgi:hypothetical protein
VGRSLSVRLEGRRKRLFRILWTKATRAVVATALVVFAGACGGSGGDDFDDALRPSATTPPPRAASTTTTRPDADRASRLRARLIASVDRTIEAHSARVSISVTVTGLPESAGGPGTFDLAGNGVVDFATGAAELEMSIPFLDQLDGGGSRVAQRVVDDVLYMRYPRALLDQLGAPPSAIWVSVDIRELAGEGVSALSRSQSDPTQQMSYILAVSDKVRAVGSEDVRGVKTTKYLATIDLASALAHGAVPPAARERLEAVAGQLGDAKLPAEIWLDQQGRMRRMAMELRLQDLVGYRSVNVGEARMAIHQDLYDFGVAVDVAPPPASAVVPLDELQP